MIPGSTNSQMISVSGSQSGAKFSLNSVEHNEHASTSISLEIGLKLGPQNEFYLRTDFEKTEDKHKFPGK